MSFGLSNDGIVSKPLVTKTLDSAESFWRSPSFEFLSINFAFLGMML